MAKLNQLEINYPMDSRSAFECIATHIFCVYLNLRGGVNRPVNKKGIESNPVQIGSRVYTFQAKYYDPATKLKDKKDEFISSIREARRQGVTNLMCFVNKDHTEDGKTGEKASYLKEIELAAQGNEDEPVVHLDWWTLSRIEQALDIPEYQYIRDIYISRNDIASPIFSSFYDYIYNRCSDDSESELYGGMSLLDSYIEPTLEINDRNTKSYLSVHHYLEEWVEGNDPITVICGEPGHGKTSLCYKAMCDYYKDGWLAGKVSNIFCFSLNPANTSAISYGSLDIYELLSWGDDRKNHKIKVNECQRALIFFDGFDELKEWYPQIDLEKFIKNYIVPFQKNTKAHVVITSRTMAVEPEKNNYILRNRILIPINTLQPISKTEQYKWIEKYIQHIHNSSSEEAVKLENYYDKYRNFFDYRVTYGDSIEELVGIPIIFRMIVAACYLPTKGQPVTGMYNDLFEVTWDRHKRQDDKDPLTVKARLAEHALQIYLDDTLTAETDISDTPPWSFSFYTTHAGNKRVGFLHRSFYQYFLAYEILSWYEKYADDNNKEKFENRLSYLARRNLDRTTLTFIRELYDQTDNRAGISLAFDESYRLLKATDGILPSPINKADSKKIELSPPLKRANNIFWNIISISGICDTSLSAEKVNILSLNLYDLSNCVFQGAQLRNCCIHNPHLANANLRNADFSGADLSGINLRVASLSGANLRGANLSGANLRGANLFKADISSANLCEADLYEANLTEAILSEAILSEAILSNANIRKANLCKANLSKTDLHAARLVAANLSGADLRYANLYGADLSNSILTNITLMSTNMTDTNVCHATMTQKDYDYIRRQPVKNLDKIIIIAEDE